jgi:hypothetical protein
LQFAAICAQVLGCLLIAACANVLKTLAAKLLATTFHRQAHFDKMQDALSKVCCHAAALAGDNCSDTKVSSLVLWCSSTHTSVTASPKHHAGIAGHTVALKFSH